MGIVISALWSERIGVTGQLFLPVVAAELETSEGRIELRPSLYRVGGLFLLGERRSVLSGYLASGVLVRGARPLRNRRGSLLRRSRRRARRRPLIGAGLRSSVTSTLGLVFNVDAALAYPRTVIRSAGDEVSTLGRPLVSGTLGLEMTWP